jgi:hypothetical protein
MFFRLKSELITTFAFHIKDLDAKLRNSAYEEDLFFNSNDSDLYKKITGLGY